MTQLSPHFTLEEFTRSETADRLGIANIPPTPHLRNLVFTAGQFERVRSALGRPVHLTSGYRCPALNHAVGGVPNSDHALGWAADTPTDDARGDVNLILGARIIFDQIIHETSRGVLHISFNPRSRMQLLTQPGGPGTPCSWGIK